MLRVLQNRSTILKFPKQPDSKLDVVISPTGDTLAVSARIADIVVQF